MEQNINTFEILMDGNSLAKEKEEEKTDINDNELNKFLKELKFIQ